MENVISQHGQSEVATAIRELSEAVMRSSAIKDHKKQEALQVIAEIAKQAETKPEGRSLGTVKALIAGFPMAVDFDTPKEHRYMVQVCLGVRSKPSARAFTEPGFEVLVVSHFVLGAKRFLIGLPRSQQVVNDARKFVCGSGDRFGSAEFCAHSAVVLTEGGVASM